jgi:hypothetical protein
MMNNFRFEVIDGTLVMYVTVDKPKIAGVDMYVGDRLIYCGDVYHVTETERISNPHRIKQLLEESTSVMLKKAAKCPA